MPKIRLVLDTNVFISAIALKSPNFRKLVDFCLEHFEVCLSPELLGELENKLKTKFVYGEAEKKQVDIITQTGTLFTKLPKVDFARDPKDQHILALCQVGKAEFLITGDKDLLELEHFLETQIISPQDFRQRVLE